MRVHIPDTPAIRFAQKFGINAYTHHNLDATNLHVHVYVCTVEVREHEKHGNERVSKRGL